MKTNEDIKIEANLEETISKVVDSPVPRGIVTTYGYTTYLLKSYKESITVTSTQAEAWGVPAGTYTATLYEAQKYVYETRTIVKVTTNTKCGIDPTDNINKGYALTNPANGLYILSTYLYTLYATSRTYNVPSHVIGSDNPGSFGAHLEWDYFVAE